MPPGNRGACGAERRSPMALLSGLVSALVELAAERRLGVLKALPVGPADEELVSALSPHSSA